MIELAVAAALACWVLDTPIKIDGWLQRLGMEPVASAYSHRFRRRATLWRSADGRYAIVLPARRSPRPVPRGGLGEGGPEGGRSCVIDMGRGWRRLAQ
ncbi:MAG: hypothetical protein ACE5JZ_02995 [Kiloniellales bacterium]